MTKCESAWPMSNHSGKIFSTKAAVPSDSFVFRRRALTPLLSLSLHIQFTNEEILKMPLLTDNRKMGSFYLYKSRFNLHVGKFALSNSVC